MDFFLSQNQKLQNRIKEELKRSQLLAQLPGGESLACKAIIKAGTIEAYATANR